MKPAGEDTPEVGGVATSVCHFYRAVVQKVLLLGEETWVLSEAMSSNLEGVHVGFLRQITDQKEVHQEDGTWGQVAE